jgi:hypothetical protein
MAIQVSEKDQPGPNGEKPRALWRSDDGHQLVCPFCDREEPSDDRLGFHLVRDHWEAIDDAANEAGDS